MYLQETLIPYDEVPHYGVQYTVCRDFDHISRYRNLRQVVQAPNEDFRMMLLESPNAVPQGSMSFYYHEVTEREENRLDLIADRYLGSATYGWVVSYYNDIPDGYTVKPGQKIKIPKSISYLLQDGELLQSVTALQLNLGSE